MSSALYKLYQQKVFELATTLVVKHTEAARAINVGLEVNGYKVVWEPTSTVPVPEKTWKYYLNISGEYHESDVPMYIKIAGDNEPLDQLFDKAFLADNPTTAEEYKYGSRFYNDLLRRYPDQELLINGILNPVDIDVAIEAENGSILYAGDYFRRIQNGTNRMFFKKRTFATRRTRVELVEDNESDLLYKLEEWIKGFLIRWNLVDYAETDDLYVPSMLGVLYSQLPKVIMNIRLANCKTPRAHSYHIREYLESHGRLAQYIPAMRKKQALWLYRNIQEIEVNAGKEGTFDDLVKNLLTESNLPLASYDIRHNLANMPTDLTPDVKMVREAINFRQTGIGTDVREVSVILDMEKGEGRENPLELERVTAEIEEMMSTRSLSNNLPTKVLESAVLDTTDRIPFPFADVLLNLWIYYASRGLYKGIIYVTHPVSGERLQLSPLNALILFYYTFNRGYAQVDFTASSVPLNIPQFIARNIPRQRIPHVNTLPPAPRFAYDMDNYVDRSIMSTDLLRDIIGAPMPEVEVLSSDDFYAKAQDVHDELQRRYRIYASQENSIARGHAEYAVSLMYWMYVPCTLVSTPQTFPEWLAARGIDFTGMQTEDYVSMANELLRNGTGAGENSNKTLRELQTAMLAIMRQFSGYNVQYLQSINDSPTLVVDWKAIRYSNDRARWMVRENVLEPTATVMKMDAVTNFRQNVGLFGESVTPRTTSRVRDKQSIDMVVSSTLRSRLNYRFKVGIPSVTVLEIQDIDTSLVALLPNDVLSGFQYTYGNNVNNPVIMTEGRPEVQANGFTTLHAGSIDAQEQPAVVNATGYAIEGAGGITVTEARAEVQVDGYATVNMGEIVVHAKDEQVEANGYAINNMGDITVEEQRASVVGGITVIHYGDVTVTEDKGEVTATTYPTDTFELDNGDILISDGDDFFVLV